MCVCVCVQMWEISISIAHGQYLTIIGQEGWVYDVWRIYLEPDLSPAILAARMG